MFPFLQLAIYLYIQSIQGAFYPMMRNNKKASAKTYLISVIMTLPCLFFSLFLKPESAKQLGDNFVITELSSKIG